MGWRQRLAWLRRLVAAALLVAGFGATASCHVVSDLFGYEIEVLPTADKVDLLLVVDNSSGTIMTDKVVLFERAIHKLVKVLTQRVDDLHVGVITTSLGGFGAPGVCDGEYENDGAHLVSRAPEGSEMPAVPTFEGKGLLKWAPKQTPEPGRFNDADALLSSLSLIMQGVGENGCGFEATLEAWYRFLVDPDPYAEVTLEDGQAVATDTDKTVLLQRDAFLRSDSLLLIVVLSDENDCSMRVGSSYYVAAQATVDGSPNSSPFHLPKARHACEQFPDDSCCKSCGQPPGEYWDEELQETRACDTSMDECCDDMPEPCDDTLPLAEDYYELRCFNQKQRFGIDFLYPIDRYVAGLGAKQVQDRFGVMRANPIFARGRDPRLVLYTSLIGVPWQDVSRRSASGEPNVNDGLDAAGAKVGGFQLPAELRTSGTWDLILGDPDRYHTEPSVALPGDRLMQESIAPREGTHPLMPGDASIQPPGAAVSDNVINGHEHLDPRALQYTCIFRLEEPIACGALVNCKCGAADAANPLCQNPEPEDGEEPVDGYQHFVPAYPGIRHLALMKRLGDRAVVGSICPINDGLPQQGQAYEPSINALLATAQPYLVSP